jgi:hypothetical protein
VGPTAGLNDVENRQFLTLPALEFRPLGRPARSQLLYRLRYPGGFAYLMPSWSLDVSLHPKALGRTKLIKDFRGFLDPRANAKLVPKFHVALPASHAGLPLVRSTFRPNVALSVLDQILRRSHCNVI